MKDRVPLAKEVARPVRGGLRLVQERARPGQAALRSRTEDAPPTQDTARVVKERLRFVGVTPADGESSLLFQAAAAPRNPTMHDAHFASHVLVFGAERVAPALLLLGDRLAYPRPILADARRFYLNAPRAGEFVDFEGFDPTAHFTVVDLDMP